VLALALSSPVWFCRELVGPRALSLLVEPVGEFSSDAISCLATGLFAVDGALADEMRRLGLHQSGAFRVALKFEEKIAEIPLLMKLL
jgi:hypothetical protein